MTRRGQVEGVLLADPQQRLSADGEIVCAGAYLSPVLLLRSGIGPAADLTRLGLPVVAGLAGVGANLSDLDGGLLRAL